VIAIAINAAFAFVQEMRAGRAVEALAQYLPERASRPPDRDSAITVETPGV
jgi:hypothetical protein